MEWYYIIEMMRTASIGVQWLIWVISKRMLHSSNARFSFMATYPRYEHRDEGYDNKPSLSPWWNDIISLKWCILPPLVYSGWFGSFPRKCCIQAMRDFLLWPCTHAMNIGMRDMTTNHAFHHDGIIIYHWNDAYCQHWCAVVDLGHFQENVAFKQCEIFLYGHLPTLWT